MRYLRLLVILSVALVLAAVQARQGEAPYAEAAFPGVNGNLGFISSREAGIGIYVLDAMTSSISRLPSGSIVPEEFEWSADGKRVVFTAIGQVFVMDADGGNITPITNAAESADQPTWSPDGSKVAFRSLGAIWVANANGTGARTKIAGGNVTGECCATDPEWSPDGTKIAFLRYFSGSEEENTELSVVSPNGGNPTQLTNNAPGYQNMEWSPDGSHMAVTDSTHNIAVLTSAGVFVRSLTNDGCSSNPAWSPDGQKIAYRGGCTGSGDIFVINANGTGTPVNVTNDAFGDSLPDWQPLPGVLAGVEFTQAIQQLQTVSGLKVDLEGDGKPPVPIIANKPMAMRVYLEEVDDSEAYTVRVTGEIDQEINVTLNPGCTATDRRKGANNCQSVDFYFTPPEGNWNVRLVVNDVLNATVADETFNLTSVKTDDVTLKAVSVCDSEGGPGGAWECQDAFPLIQDASLSRRMLPTADVKVIVTGDVIRRNEADYSETIRWWGQVDRDLDALHTATDEMFGQQGTEIYYIGMVRNQLPGNTNGAAYIDTRGAANRAGFPATVAHEVGHAMGLDHTDTGVPAYSGGFGCSIGDRTELPPYPYADNRLRSGAAPGEIEVGFDVASGVALNGEFFFDIMSYCTSTAPPIAPDITRWITPFSTLELMSPAGPLAAGPAQPAAGPASAPGDFWLVQGTIDPISQGTTLDPLITLQGNGPTGAGAGTHRIEVHDGGGGILFTRLFTPSHGHASPNPGEEVQSTGSSFAELVPVQPGAASIQVFDALQMQIASVDLGGVTPVVESITLPASFDGLQPLSWTVTDGDSTAHTYWVDYSPNGGQTWQHQGQALTENSLMVDFDLLASSAGQGVFRVIASDGVLSGETTSAPFSVAGKAPHGEIIGPQGTSFRQGNLVWLAAAAWDVDDGTLDDGAVTWTSNRDGNLGTGASLPLYDLSVGTHTITMTARDADNNEVSDTIIVTVSDSPLSEGGIDRTWGDVKCDGNVNLGDSIALARTLVSLDPGQSAGCPEMGAAVTVEAAQRTWGDVDCGGSLGLGDAISIARFLVGIVPDVAGCPAMGSTVKVHT